MPVFPEMLIAPVEVDIVTNIRFGASFAGEAPFVASAGTARAARMAVRSPPFLSESLERLPWKQAGRAFSSLTPSFRSFPALRRPLLVVFLGLVHLFLVVSLPPSAVFCPLEEGYGKSAGLLMRNSPALGAGREALRKPAKEVIPEHGAAKESQP